MTCITPSLSTPGSWQSGERVLTPGDIIEVLLLDTWYRARFRYDTFQREYQLLIGGHPCSISLLEGQPSRWLDLERSTSNA